MRHVLRTLTVRLCLLFLPKSAASVQDPTIPSLSKELLVFQEIRKINVLFRSKI